MNAIGDVGIAIAMFFMVRDLGTTDFSTVLPTAPQHWAQGSTDANLVALRAAGRGGGQVGPAPAPDLASRRHGRPHPGLRADPRRHHGDRRRVPGRAHPRDLRERPRHPRPGGDAGPRDAADGGRDRDRADGYQAHHRLLHDEPDRLHVHGRGGRRLHRQGMFLLLAHAFFKALLFLGAGIVIHASRRRAGRPQDGRAGLGATQDQVADVDRHRRPDRVLAASARTRCSRGRAGRHSATALCVWVGRPDRGASSPECTRCG